MTSKVNKFIAVIKRLQSTAHHQHNPLIKFIGKRVKGTPHINPMLPNTPVLASTGPSKLPLTKTSSPNVKDFFELKGKAFYGRPRFSQAEIDSIMSGGAV